MLSPFANDHKRCPGAGIGIARIRAIIDAGETWRGIKVVIVAEPVATPA
jgi:hypothetical protein